MCKTLKKGVYEYLLEVESRRNQREKCPSGKSAVGFPAQFSKKNKQNTTHFNSAAVNICKFYATQHFKF